MEGGFGGGAPVNGGSAGDSSRQPMLALGSFRSLQCFAGGGDRKPTLVRHASLMKTKISDAPVEPKKSRENCNSEFLPIVRSGGWADIGFRRSMEDVVYVCCDNLMHEYWLMELGKGPSAFFGILLAATCSGLS